MKCKIFYNRNRERLQDFINEWLEKHMVVLETLHFQFTTVIIESPSEYVLEHTLVLFYLPRVDEEEPHGGATL